jgi:hypothetical protein
MMTTVTQVGRLAAGGAGAASAKALVTEAEATGPKWLTIEKE